MPGLIDGLPDTVALTCLAFVSYYLYPKLELVSRSWKAVFRSVELFKERRVVGLHEDFLAVCCRGQSNIWQLYDHVHKFWITLPIVPSKTRHLVYFGVVSAFQKIFVIGGHDRSGDSNTTNEVWSFDLITRTWSMLAPMLVSRASFACCVVDGKIVVAGGYTISRPSKLTLKAEMYDIENDVWIPLPDLHRFTDENLCGLMIGGKMHIGCNSFVQVFDSLEMKWRVEDYTWSPGRQKVVVQDSLYVKKWIQENRYIIIKQNGRDTQIVSSPRHLPGIAMQMVSFGGELHIIGGMSNSLPKELLSDVHILNVGDENPTWRYGTPMFPPCYGLVPTLRYGTPISPQGHGIILKSMELRI